MEKDGKKKRMENLIPLNKRPKNEVAEITSKGGVKAAETKRRQKTILEIMKVIDGKKLPKKDALSLKKIFDIDDPTFREAVIMTLYQQILSGNLRAIELYLKLKGEFPKDVLNANERSLTIVWKENRYGIDTETE